MNRRPDALGGRPPENKYLGLDPLLLAHNASELWKINIAVGKPAISKPVALGLVMKKEGKEILREAFPPIDDQGIALAPDINFVINRLSNESNAKFYYGFGEVVLGSMLEALERGIFEWDDDAFFAYLNEAVIGTPMPKADLMRVMKEITSVPKKIPKDQARIIRHTLEADKGFFTFLEDNSLVQKQNLPPTIYAYLYNLQPAAGEGLRRVVPKYKAALAYLN